MQRTFRSKRVRKKHDIKIAQISVVAAASLSGVVCVPAFGESGSLQQNEQANPTDKPATELDLSLDAAAAFDDNIFATQNQKVSDVVFTLEPAARFDVGGTSAGLTLRSEGEIARYRRNSDEDFDDWTLGVDLKARPFDNFQLIAGAEYQWEHESRVSPDDANGVNPTKYKRGYAYAGALVRSGRFFTRAGSTVTTYEFDDADVVGGSINNSDRDRFEFEGGARIGFYAAEGTSLFVQGAYDRRDYDALFDDFGFDRDSAGYSLAAGVRRKFSHSVSGEIYGGVLRRNYQNASLPAVKTFDIGGELDWKTQNGLGGAIRLSRSINETTLPGASAYILTDGGISARIAPHPRLSSGIGLTGAHYDYEGRQRSEFVFGADIWANYWLTPRLFAGVDYNFSQRTSDAAGFDFSKNRLMARLGAQLAPRDFPGGETFAPIIAAAAPGGAYLSVFTTYGALTTGLYGPRGSGTNVADFGESGLGYGGAVGYGFVVGRLYVGAELEGTGDSARWTHLSGREFSADKANGFGGGVRFGYVTDANNLVFSRISILSSEFATEYETQSAQIEQHERVRGLGFGIGAEAGGTGREFVKFEYVLAAYDDYDIATGPSSVDNFSNVESQFRVGVGFRSGAAKPVDEKETDFSGPYVGLQLGHGALISANEGVRSGGSLLDVTRGAHGPLLGAFAGAGKAVSRIYVGVEAELDFSDIDWNIERDPTGRTYSAEHDYSFGAGLRGGVLIGGSSLVYCRAGATWTRFATDFETSHETVNSRLMRRGLRFGGGVETALTDKARLRIEYAFTTYRGYDVEYGAAVDSLKNSEVLFRLGLARSL